MTLDEERKEELDEKIFKTKQDKRVDGFQLIQTIKHKSPVFVPNRIIFDWFASMYNENFAYQAFDEYFKAKNSVEVSERRSETHA